MNKLEEKIYLAILNPVVSKAAIASECESLAKEFAKNFDVWKFKNNWFAATIKEGVMYYNMRPFSNDELTFDQLLSLYEEHLKSKP